MKLQRKVDNWDLVQLTNIYSDFHTFILMTEIKIKTLNSNIELTSTAGIPARQP